MYGVRTYNGDGLQVIANKKGEFFTYCNKEETRLNYFNTQFHSVLELQGECLMSMSIFNVRAPSPESGLPGGGRCTLLPPPSSVLCPTGI